MDLNGKLVWKPFKPFITQPRRRFKGGIDRWYNACGQHFNHSDGRLEFDCAVDHRALPYIMKSKNLPATGRIIRLLEHLSGYCFNLYYVKGKDMILCDYLSRIVVDKGDSGEVIPISFNALAQYRLALTM